MARTSVLAGSRPSYIFRLRDRRPFAPNFLAWTVHAKFHPRNSTSDPVLPCKINPRNENFARTLTKNLYLANNLDRINICRFNSCEERSTNQRKKKQSEIKRRASSGKQDNRLAFSFLSKYRIFVIFAFFSSRSPSFLFGRP